MGRVLVRRIGNIAALIVAVSAASCARQSAPAQSPPQPLVGTYELFVCKGPCPLGDSTRAVAVGRLVLQDSAISLTPLERPSMRPRPDSADLHLQLGRWGRARGRPNGCYIFDQRAEQPETYAGIRRVGIVSWRVRAETDSAVVFSLYGSPDAGHSVTLVRPDGSGVLRGIGHSWGADAAAVNHWPDDSVVARRIGPPDVEPCFAAAAAEWRRIRHGPHGP